MYRDTYVEVNNKVIENNVKSIIKHEPNYKYYIGVVKGNAYGHGYGIIKSLVKGGINYLAVSYLEEALEIRENYDKKTPILILQPVAFEYLDICIKNKIAITISSYQYYQELKKLKVKGLMVHLKIDSGMNRLGLNKLTEIETIYNELMTSKDIELVGIYTHLATVGIMDNRFDKQINTFKELTKGIDLNKIKIVHLFSSNAYAIHPKLKWANGVRLGITMYGISPRNINTFGFKGYLRKLKIEYKRQSMHLSPLNKDFSINVHPALKLVSKVIEIKKVDSSEYIGYGNHYQASDDMYCAIVPVGYMDGLSLQNSGRNVYINNKPYPIVGVVNMGMITVRVDESVEVGNRVEVIKDIRNEANYVKTTPHQYLASINPNLKRVYIEEDI